MLTVLLVALSLGLSNFAASIAIGISGINRNLRLRIASVFGVFEAGMPLIGLLVGRSLASSLGGSAHIIGGILLIATGAHAIWSNTRGGDDGSPENLATTRTIRLLVLGAALSIDNLVVGFALGADYGSVLESIAAITVVSVGLSLIALELGARLGSRVERHGELIAGLVLIAVGLAILTDLI